MTIPTLSNFSVPFRFAGNVPFTLTPPTSNSGGAFSYASSKPSVATVGSTTGLVTIVGAGFTTITATQAASGSFTSASITAKFAVFNEDALTNQELDNVFQPLSDSPHPGTDIIVSGKFRDYKQDVKFDVDITYQASTSYSMAVTEYAVTIDYLAGDDKDIMEKYNFYTDSIPDSIGKRINGSIVRTDTRYERGNDKGFPFINLQIYSINHHVEIVKTNNDADNTVTPAIPATTVKYKLSHTQIFRYYETPVDFSDFSFDENVGLGDDLRITGLVLNHGANFPIDPTEPEMVKFTFSKIDSYNNASVIYFDSEKLFDISGNYTIQLPPIPPSQNPQGFELGNAYNIAVQGKWALGYSTSETSSQSLNLLSRPEITNIEVLQLSVDDDDDIMEITLAELSSSGSVEAPSKVWFEFRNSLGTLVAIAGGDPVTGPGVTIPDSNIILLKLSDIELEDDVGLLNGIDYSVIAKIKYETLNPPVYRDSDPYEEVNFVLTEPTISSIVENPLYIRDTDEKIATINVTHEAYELYAPHETAGIKFVFYSDGGVEVARTSAYTFVNTLTSSATTEYPIKLSEVTPKVLTHGVTYKVKSEVTLTDHSSESVTRLSDVFTTISFDLTEPDIFSIDKNPLYIANSSANIATINVTREAYELYAPYDEDGILFVFYDGATEVARTSAYPFVNTEVDGTQPYPIKLSEITPTSGVYLENGVTYTVKAAVKVTNHAGTASNPETTSYVVSSKSSTVNFDLERPVISVTAYDVQNDGGQDGVFHPDSTDVDSASQIVATVDLINSEYELYAPDVTDGVRFIFYDASEIEVARTTDYDFSNDGSNLYNIQLDHITASTLLTNGTPYKVKAEVTLTNHSASEELRLSANFFDVTFSQNIAPVISVNISNTWALVSNNVPESYTDNFLASPPIGISGNFSKNAQFGSLYYKHLDTTYTKFKLEYRVLDANAPNNVVTDWTPVKKAKLVLQGSSVSNETLEIAANRARSSAGTLPTVSSGEYTNIPGTGLGTSQGDIVFYMPQQQEGTTDAFDETHKVEVRVAVIDRNSPSLWGGNISSEYTESNSLYVILKIDLYDYTIGESSEPWNSVVDGVLRINIPVSWNSEYSYSVEVSYNYISDASNNYGAAVEILRGSALVSTSSTVSFDVDPTIGTTLYYRVRYVVTNPNLGAGATTNGIFTKKDVDNKFFPESSDYVVSNTSYMTFNDDGESSITFDLSFNIDPQNRCDGVNVYFTSTDSNIDKVRIGTYDADQLNKEITLLVSSGGDLQVLDDVAPGTNLSWDNYTSANISFEAYRDARVESTDATYVSVSNASAPEESGFYVESGSQSTFGTSSDSNPIWNIPVLTTPGQDGGIILSGGVINIINTDPSSNHFISWTAAIDQAYTYNLEMFKDNDLVTAIQTNNGLTPTSGEIITKELNIALDATAKYTVNIRKVFEDEISEPTVIVFHTINVVTSSMALSVINPSNTSSVKLSWNNPSISGNSVQSLAPSFANNISTQYIQYRIGSSGSYARLDEDDDADDVEASPKSYTLPSEAVPGTLLEFVMFIEANVSYTVDGVLSSTNSNSHDIPLTPTPALQYIVSSIPSVDVIPNSDGINIVPVLVQGSSNPTLLLNLNANGLEVEGFISVVVILTQDGTDTKPEGEQALLIFPDSNNHPFSFPNTVSTNVGNLAGGESATSVPRNDLQDDSSLSTQNYSYTLTIGTVETTGEDAGRYGLSTLQMPSSQDSGFVSGYPVNYMVILTTRRGTDIGVGEFAYEALPSVQNVQIVTENGQYYVQFNITPA